jgi:hypothetical protein
VSLPFLGFLDEWCRTALADDRAGAGRRLRQRAADLAPARVASVPGADSTLSFSPLFAILQCIPTPAMGCGKIRKQILLLMAEGNGVA